MRIKMLSTRRGSVNGHTEATFEAGWEYDLTHTEGERDLARVFVRERWAIDLDVKAVDAAPANKARAVAPERAARPQ